MNSPSTFGVIVHGKMILQDLVQRFLLFSRLATVSVGVYESHPQSHRADVLSPRARALGDGKVIAKPRSG
jgi:hypothetical protein